VRREKSGLTVIEILVVVSIIAVLVGILIPAMSMVQNTAKTVKQRAQFTAIDLGLAAFRGDYGDYPPSDWWNPSSPSGPQNYCGAQKLAEALLGWDLLGFHPNSAWRGDGLDAAGGPDTYDPLMKYPPVVRQENLKKRRDRYIELDTANAFKLRETAAGRRDGLFVDATPLARNTYVLCDVFEVSERKLQLEVDPLGVGRSAVPGTPILYYRANPASKVISGSGLDPELRIYNSRDNAPLVNLGRVSDWNTAPALRKIHPLAAALPSDHPYFPDDPYFYEYIRDPKVQAHPWPYRADTYLLISAGPDGWYGTSDDVCNFGKK
jgi:type II secretory pathway pseudopilin PulG